MQCGPLLSCATLYSSNKILARLRVGTTNARPLAFSSSSKFNIIRVYQLESAYWQVREA